MKLGNSSNTDDGQNKKGSQRRVRNQSFTKITFYHDYTMTDFTSHPPSCKFPQNSPESIMQYLKCTICIDVLKKPVTTSCGHTFCKSCLDRHVAINDQNCPLCKNQLAEINVNIVLKEILKELQKPLMRSPDEFTAKPGEVPCDVCNEGPKYKAERSCLICLLSFCKRHLKGHQKSRFKGHKLVPPVNDLDHWACLVHGRPLELYSASEGKLICSLCVQEGTNLVSAEDEKERKQAELCTEIHKFEQGIHQRQENISELDNSESVCLNLINQETMEIKKMFCAMKKAIQKAEAEVLRPLEERRKKVEQEAHELKGDLRGNIETMSKTISGLQLLRDEEDPVYFLQNYSSTTVVADGSDWNSVSLNTDLSFGTMRNTEVTIMANIKDEFEKLSKIEIARVRKFGVDVTLDPDTANAQLLISDDMRQVQYSEEKRDVPDCPERFDMFGSVLGQNRITDSRAFWVVEVGNKKGWDIGVAKEEANRKGAITVKPSQGYWVIVHYNGDNYAALEDTPIVLSLLNAPCKVGVFVDYNEKLVSFYNMEAETHIYSFTGCDFGAVIRPYFSPHMNEEDPLVICPVNPNK